MITNKVTDPVQLYEIRNCITELLNDEACGPELIHNVMIIKGDKMLWHELTKLFNECLQQGSYPQHWNYANIHSIPKPKKIHSNPKIYRPIAVSSCLGRIFEKVLAKRLQHYCVKNQIFSNDKCGFQIDRSTADVLTDFPNDAYTTIDQNSVLDCAFTDFSKAYDSVWHNDLPAHPAGFHRAGNRERQACDTAAGHAPVQQPQL